MKNEKVIEAFEKMNNHCTSDDKDIVLNCFAAFCEYSSVSSICQQ